MAIKRKVGNAKRSSQVGRLILKDPHRSMDSNYVYSCQESDKAGLIKMFDKEVKVKNINLVFLFTLAVRKQTQNDGPENHVVRYTYN